MIQTESLMGKCMNKTTLILMIVEIVSKIVGFTKYIILGLYYGTSYMTDAYLISLTIPLTIFDSIGNGITTTFIPIYSKMLSRGKDKESAEYVSNLINVLFVCSTFIITFSIAFAPYLVKLFASGFSQKTFHLTVILTRVAIIGIYFTTLISVLTGFLYANKNYIVPKIMKIPFNLIIIFSIIISSKTNIVLLSVGTLLAIITEFVALAFFSYKRGYRHIFRIDLNDQNLRKMQKLSVSTIIGTSVEDINKLVDRTIASQIIIGGISALSFADRLNEFVQQIFVGSVVTVMYPNFAKMVADGKMNKFKTLLSGAIGTIYLTIVPAAVGAMIFSKPIVEILFGRGAFDFQAVHLTSQGLFFYSIGMIPFGTREVLSKALYSLQDMKTPMINAGIAMILNFVLNMILSRYLGIGGLALASSISAIVCTALLFTNLRKKIGSFCLKSVAISFIKILFASVIMGALAQFTYQSLMNNINENISLLFSIGVGAFVYIIIIYFMKIEEVDLMVRKVKKKIKTIFS